MLSVYQNNHEKLARSYKVKSSEGYIKDLARELVIERVKYKTQIMKTVNKWTKVERKVLISLSLGTKLR